VLLGSCRTPAGCTPPFADDDHSGVPPAIAAPDASDLLMEAITDLCRADFTAEGLIERFAPGAVQAGGRILPPGTEFIISNEAVTTLYTRSQVMRIVWWPKPAGDRVSEVHIVSEAPTILYADFVREHGLGAGETLEQTHPLADLQHRHAVTCRPGRSVAVVLYEVVWKGDAVGKIREVAVLGGG